MLGLGHFYNLLAWAIVCFVIIYTIPFQPATDKEHQLIINKWINEWISRNPNAIENANQDMVWNPNTGSLDYFVKYLTVDDPIIVVPRYWCDSPQSAQRMGYMTRGKHEVLRMTNTAIERLVDECFTRDNLAAEDEQSVRMILRQIKKTFVAHHIEMWMTFGSALGSLRYHTRMFFDVDYDFTVALSDFAATFSILTTLALDPTNQMRLADSRPLKLGLLCGDDVSWREKNKTQWPAWTGQIPKLNTDTDYVLLLKPCKVYIDFYSAKPLFGTRLVTHTAEEAIYMINRLYPLQYRPLEGSLFKSLANLDWHLVRTYQSDLNKCVPKTKKMVCLEEERKLSIGETKCSNLQFSCHFLDRLRPRVRAFTFKRKHIEVALDWDELHIQCKVRSVFVNQRGQKLNS